MKIRKYIALIAFVIIIFMPSFLSILKTTTGIDLDTPLKGFTDSVSEPTFSFKGFLSGSFQQEYSAWKDQNVTLHGAMTKTYNSIRYDLFDVASRPIGKDGFVYEEAYIEAELNIGPKYDYSIPSNQADLQSFVNSLVSVNNKLEGMGKHLYVYIAPSKADFYPETIPENYKALATPGSVNGTDLFVSLLGETDIKFLRCSDLKDELEYPAFYYTGIHWSRTFEQYVSNYVLYDLMELTGKDYRRFEFTDVWASDVPFNRDTDVYDLLNLWEEPDITYYQYNYNMIVPENYDRLGIMMYGDSFAQGLRSDVFSAYPDESIYYVNNNNYIVDYKNFQYINHDFGNIDWQTCLDRSDVVVIEITEALICDYSKGFVPYLDNYLDTYVPSEPTYSLMDRLDINDTFWDGSEWYGIYSNEGSFAWASNVFELTLEDESIATKGLDLEFVVPEYVVTDGVPDEMNLYVNGHLVGTYEYTEAGNKVINIPASDLTSENGTYSIFVTCSRAFNPVDLGTTDDRILGLQLIYIGAGR